MKNKKTRTQLVAFVAVFVSVWAMITVPVSAKRFNDIPSGFWGADGVNYVSDNGYMNGTAPNQFSPNTSLSRAMAVATLYRKEGSPSVAGIYIPFTDVPSNAWYSAAVKWAYSNNIVNGITPEQFSPSASIKRQDLAVIFSRYAIYHSGSGVSTNYSVLYQFSDWNQISGYAKQQMTWAIETGIISGTTSTTLDPQANVTRAQYATILTRYGTNIERIRPQKDNLGIVHDDPSFTQNEYFITDAHVAKMHTYVVDYLYGVGEGTQRMRVFDIERNKEWGGSCYGIAVVEALDKMGRIAFNESYYPSLKCLYDINNTNCNIMGSPAESAINYYYLSQYVLDSPYGSHSGALPTVSDEIQNAYNALSSGKSFAMISVFHHASNSYLPIYGHSFLANSASKTGNVYSFNIVDPNYPDSYNKTLTYNTSTGIMKLSNRTIYPFSIYILTDFSLFSLIDIDGRYNEDELNNRALSFDSEPQATNNRYSDNELDKNLGLISPRKEDTATIMIQLNDSFIVENAEGETLIWSNDQLSGTMSYSNCHLTVDGEDVPSTLIINVPLSQEFTYSPDHESSSVNFCVIGSKRIINVKGAGFKSVIADIEEGNVHTQGICKNIELAYGTDNPEEPLCIISGAESKNGGYNVEGNDLVLSGSLQTVHVEFHNVLGETIRSSDYSSTEPDTHIIIGKTNN